MLKYFGRAVTGVAQLVGCCPTRQKVTGSIPSQDTQKQRPITHKKVEQQISICLSLSLSPLSLSLFLSYPLPLLLSL